MKSLTASAYKDGEARHMILFENTVLLWIVSQPPVWRDVEGIDLIALRDLAETATVNVSPYVVSVATGRWP